MVRLKLNAANVEKIVKEYGWKGTGSKEHPYIFENYRNSNLRMKFKKLDAFITIHNCSFKNIALIRCKNVKLELCTFNLIDLNRCRNITIKNCKFKRFLELALSAEIIIKNNIFEKVVPYFCQALSITNNEIQQLSVKYIENDPKIKIVLNIGLLIFIIFDIIYFFFSLIILPFLLLTAIFFVAIFAIFEIPILLIIRRYIKNAENFYFTIKNLGLNRIENNKIDLFKK